MTGATFWNPRDHSGALAVLFCSLALLYAGTAQLMIWLPHTLVWHAIVAGSGNAWTNGWTCFDCGFEGNDSAITASLIGIGIALPASVLAGLSIIAQTERSPNLRRDVARVLGIAGALFGVAMVFLFDDTVSSLLSL